MFTLKVTNEEADLNLELNSFKAFKFLALIVCFVFVLLVLLLVNRYEPSVRNKKLLCSLVIPLTIQANKKERSLIL